MTWYDDAMRTIVEIPDSQLEVLDAFCRRERISRAEAVRRALAEPLRTRREADPDRAFGLWRGRTADGVAFERRIRREWNR